MKKLTLALAGFLVGGFLATRTIIYVTRPGQATVIFDAFQGLERDRVQTPGISFLAPLVDRPITYDVRTRVWEFTDDTNNPNRLGSAITVNSADGQAFAIPVAVALRPNPNTLDDLHAEIGENYLNTVVVPVVRSKFRDVAAEFDSEDFYQQELRSQIEARARAAIGREMLTTSHDGGETAVLLIDGIFLGTPAFPQGLKDSIELKQVAGIKAAAAAVQAEIQNKETERVLILARANQEAIELKGEAAAANAQLGDLLFYEKLEERVLAARNDPQGEQPFKIIRVEGESTLFLNVDPKTAAIAGQ